jgi:hypothetical protein
MCLLGRFPVHDSMHFRAESRHLVSQAKSHQFLSGLAARDENVSLVRQRE